MRTTTLILAALILVSAASAANAQDGAQSTTLRYVGELIDDGGAPISGVFPLTFKLYETARSTQALWAERHFVAVQGGAYTVVLGEAAQVPQALAGRDLFIAVEVGTIGELLRQPYTVAFTPPPQTREQVVASLNLTYADVSDRALLAVEAERADDCLLLDGRSLDEIDRYDEVLGEIATLRDQLDDVTGASLGSRSTTLERAGGSGGNPYSRTCPPGHVVTGMRGGAGSYVDSIELICSPLE
ncbi:MAG: hypothetical protein H6698_02830 [Myxococcales bacterium]|nr:hypothetical protein [Myxococcales bacterium]MCB9533249.1 hypothetical protein [Myxococcales bacterium]